MKNKAQQCPDTLRALAKEAYKSYTDCLAAKSRSSNAAGRDPKIWDAKAEQWKALDLKYRSRAGLIENRAKKGKQREGEGATLDAK